MVGFQLTKGKQTMTELTVKSQDSCDLPPAIVGLVLDGLVSPHTKRAYARALAHFGAWHAGQGRPALRKAVVMAYRQHLLDLGFAPATVNQRLAAIRKLAAEAVDNGFLDPTLAAGIARVPGVRDERLPAGRALSPGEIAAMFRACAVDASPAGARDAALLALLRMGLRRAEIAGLDLDDLDLEAGTVTVDGKGRKQRAVPLAPGALDALAAWLEVRGAGPGALLLAVNKGGRIVPHGIGAGAVYKALAKRAGQAGVKKLSPHDWRRTFVGDLLDAGADLAVVARLAGHSNVQTTARYDRRPEGAKRAAVGLLAVPFCAS